MEGGGGVSAVPQKKYTIFQNYQFFDISLIAKIGYYRKLCVHLEVDALDILQLAAQTADRFLHKKIS